MKNTKSKPKRLYVSVMPLFLLSFFSFFFVNVQSKQNVTVPSNIVESYDNMENVRLLHPLSDASCEGYFLSRGFADYHAGIDWARTEGCVIKVAGKGIVESAGWSSDGSGFSVVIDHGNGLKTEYNHGNGEFLVSAGDSVEKGQNIMMMGISGNATGTHLHFAVKVNDAYADPMMFLE